MALGQGQTPPDWRSIANMIKRIDLCGAWEFQEAGADTWKSGTVPGCVQLDLLKLGEVPDPFVGMNEIHMHRLEEKDWVYRREFELRERDLARSQVDLVFEGIDTYADVYLNDWYLGRAEDMFMPYRYDVTDIVTPGKNVLEVRLFSPLTTIKDLERKSPLSLMSNCETARPYVRKAQYAYGWDWGPRIAQVGLWRPAYLELIRCARLLEPFFYAESATADSARVRVSATVESFREDEDEGHVPPLQAAISMAIGGTVQAEATVPVRDIAGEAAIDATLVIESPQLWWPNGIGAQPLYDITITLLSEGKRVDELAFRSGIRTVSILQEGDREGKTFIFQVNDTKVFAKGADWVPADSLLPRLTREDYFDYIRLAKEANMNMLRIWGGGIYEDPAFYDACDELGIMVWQDFMYACAQYPDELDWFQELARDEAVSVVTSLRNHPSIVLWCGNNENNWGFDEWWHNGQPKYLGNYVYREILPEVCARHDPSRPYWVSSPYGGEHPNSPSEGDRHSWSVWSGWQDYSGYLADTGRFLSEFGFQAMPAWKTVLSYAAPEDRHVLSPVVLSHNKMTEGMERLTRFMVGRLGFPKDFQSFVYLSQLNQAEAIKTGVEHWRLRKFMTAGALYWQLNDCWPVASWACLDYYRRKKGLYYYTRRFFADLLPVLRMEEGEVVLYGVSDRLCEASGEARISAYHLDGRKLGEKTVPAKLFANEVTKLARLAIAELGIGYSPRVLPVDGSSTTLPREHNGELLDAVVYVELTVDGQSYSNYLVFDRFRSLALRPPKIDVAIEGPTVTLCSDVPAFGVFLEPERDVDLSDNCLCLMPGVPYHVTCSGEPGAVQVSDLTSMVSAM
jgi:beta-mannosidase